MLVLSRKVGEKIVIGGQITIVVQRVSKGRVAIAIEAPHSIPVLRGELAPFGVEVDEAAAALLEQPTTTATPSPKPANPTNAEKPARPTGSSSAPLRGRMPKLPSTRPQRSAKAEFGPEYSPPTSKSPATIYASR